MVGSMRALRMLWLARTHSLTSTGGGGSRSTMAVRWTRWTRSRKRTVYLFEGIEGFVADRRSSNSSLGEEEAL